MSKLTAVQIRQAKPYKLPDGQGFYFHVAESGKSTRFRVDGKESICVLDEYPDMTEAREQVKAGKNP